MERDKLTADEVRARMAAQMDDTKRRARAKYVLENDGDLEHLRRQVEALLPKLTPRPARQAAAAAEGPAPAECEAVTSSR
jgi:dephospho-CoA kinase